MNRDSAARPARDDSSSGKLQTGRRSSTGLEAWLDAELAERQRPVSPAAIPVKKPGATAEPSSSATPAAPLAAGTESEEPVPSETHDNTGVIRR